MSYEIIFPTQDIEIVRNSSFDYNYVAPLDVLNVKHVITFPEGRILQVSVYYNVSARPIELTSGFVTAEPYFTEIFPMSERYSFILYVKVYSSTIVDLD